MAGAKGKMRRIRLDTLLLNRGVVESRQRAKAIILHGSVTVDGKTVDKAGAMVREDASIMLHNRMPYASRGGLKLEKAIKAFGVNVKGRVAMDIGASTGGFTDCLLKHGARRVYAIDVGYGQLDWRLRNDERVIPFEKTNIRYLGRDAIPEKVDLITIDVSFISLLKVIPRVLDFLSSEGETIALVKPQFELQRRDIGKGGVVRDEGKRLEAVKMVKEASKAMGLDVLSVFESPVRGPKGNVEYFIHLKKRPEHPAIS